ncbi:protein of unknown function [Thauera humireducens]|nr:protein of unknown function [Thauera humireducens]
MGSGRATSPRSGFVQQPVAADNPLRGLPLNRSVDWQLPSKLNGSNGVGSVNSPNRQAAVELLVARTALVHY